MTKPTVWALLALAVSMQTVGPVPGQTWDQDDGTCAILASDIDPVYGVFLSFVPDSHFAGYGGSAFLELSADWEFAYFKEILFGDVDLSLVADTTVFSDAARLRLPDQVAQVGVDAGWT
ncbi:hypothetical protein ACFLSJ_02590, partial [Verrucomicrobiota bacterium]